jgi:hypothetical protein
MTTLQNNDLFLVERESTQYKVENKNMGQVLDTDLFLVERDGVQYKVTGDQVGAGPTGEFEEPVEVLTPLNGAGIGTGVPYNPISSPITVVGAGGVSNCETELIESVSTINQANPAGQVLAGPSPEATANTVDIKAGIDAVGITGIRGFALYSGGSTSAALFAFNVDSVNVIPALSGLVDSGDAFAPFSEYKTNAYVQSEDDNTENNGFYSFIFDEFSVATASTLTLQLRDYANNDLTIQVLAQDNQWYTLINQTRTPPAAVGPTLTFPSDQGFDCFQVGDVVQIEPDPNYFLGDYVSMSIIKTTAEGNWGNVFNGTVGLGTSVDNFISPISSGPDNECVFTLDTPIKVTDKVTLNALIEYEGAIRLNETYNVPTSTQAYGAVSDISASSIGGELSKVTVARNTTGAYLAAITVDGKLLVDPSVAPGIEYDNVSIISIDDTVPSITVDGGTWDSSNQSQVWSNSLTSSGTFDRGPEYAFDGIIDSSNECRSGDGDTLTFAPTGGIPFTTSVEVYNQSTFNQVIVNTGSPVAMNAVSAWITVATGTGTINTMQFSDTTSGKVAFGGIKVDGKVLVDAVEDSQVWSSYGSSDGTDGALFDGSLDTYGGSNFSYNFWSNGPTATQSIEVAFDTSDVYTNTVTINGSDNLVPFTGGAKVFVDVTSKVGLGRIDTIVGTMSSDRSATGLLGIKIDGKVLQDKGIRNLGDTKLVKEMPYGASLTCTDSIELANMVGPITMTDENGDLVTPQTSEIVSVSGTAPAITLTFADSTDLEYFSAGDVVQESPSGTPININQSGASIIHSSPQGLPTDFGNNLPTISYAEIRSASTDQWNNVFTPDVSANFTYQMIELEYPVTSIQFTTQGSYIMTACSADGVTWEQLEQSPAGQTATTRTATGGPFKYWYIGFNAATSDNTDNYYLSCNAVPYSSAKIISVDAANSQMVVDGGKWDVSNQSEVWSENVANDNSASPASLAFDGDLTTVSYAADTETITCAFDRPIPVTTLRVKGSINLGSEVNLLKFNTTDVTSQLSETTDWQTITGVSSISSISWATLDTTGAAYKYFGAIAFEVDGKILVDAAEDSQVWSNNAALSSGAYAAGMGPENLFDGDLSTVVQSETANVSLTISNIDIDYTTSVEVYLQMAGVAIYINESDTPGFTQSLDSVTPEWVTVDSGSGTLNSIKIEGIDSAAADGAPATFVYAFAIRVDGKLMINQGIRNLGDSYVSLPTLEASATDVMGVDGSSLLIDGVSGTWKTGLNIKGAEITPSAPSPTAVVFTSMNGGTTAVTGTDASLTRRVWTLEKSSSQSGPWTVVGEYIDLDANASQDGATPWSGKPILEANTYYQVKVAYYSDNANSVESIFNTFKTGDA